MGSWGLIPIMKIELTAVSIKTPEGIFGNINAQNKPRSVKRVKPETNIRVGVKTGFNFKSYAATVK